MKKLIILLAIVFIGLAAYLSWYFLESEQEWYEEYSQSAEIVGPSQSSMYIFNALSQVPNISEQMIEDGFYYLGIQELDGQIESYVREVSLEKIKELPEYQDYVVYLSDDIQKGVAVPGAMPEMYKQNPQQAFIDLEEGRLSVLMTHPGVHLLEETGRLATYQERVDFLTQRKQELSNKSALTSADLRELVVLDGIFANWKARDEAARILCATDQNYCQTREIVITMDIEDAPADLVYNLNERPGTVVEGNTITTQAYPSELVIVTAQDSEGLLTSGPLYVEVTLGEQDQQTTSLQSKLFSTGI